MFYLNLMQPVPGPGAVHRTCISVLGTEDVCVIPLGQTSLNRLNESLKSRKLPAVSGDVGIEVMEGVAVSKKPTNFCKTFDDLKFCSVTGTIKLKTSHRFHIKRPRHYRSETHKVSGSNRSPRHMHSQLELTTHQLTKKKKGTSHRLIRHKRRQLYRRVLDPISFLSIFNTQRFHEALTFCETRQVFLISITCKRKNQSIALPLTAMVQASR